MKILLYIIIGLLGIMSLYFVNLSVSSRKQPDLGLFNNQLRICPTTPNCVSSEQSGAGVFVEPLTIKITTDVAWRKAKKAVVDNGGEIVSENDGYLHAQFVTPLMRYIDDVELRLDENKQIIHIRSASRVGRSDFGANRARVEKVRAAFLTNTQSGN